MTCRGGISVMVRGALLLRVLTCDASKIGGHPNGDLFIDQEDDQNRE